MLPVVTTSGTRDQRAQLRLMRAIIAVLVVALVVLNLAYFAGLGRPALVQAAEPAGGDPSGQSAAAVIASTTTAPSTSTVPITTTSSSTFTTTTIAETTTTSSPPAPSRPAHRYVVPSTEAAPEAKQAAVDIAYSLTTYDTSDDHTARLRALGSHSGVDLLIETAAPLTHTGSWSRGEVLYPQMGGLTDERASVMVVLRQTVGVGSDAHSSVVRTLDIRLVRGASGWEFDHLDSAGGSFDQVEDLTLAHAVAADPRIEMSDSARLDIRSGLVSPILLEVMAELADQTSYGVAVLATGHPHNVFETDRQSDHTRGRAVDIIRVGDRSVIDDRGPDSATRAVVEWLFENPKVVQVGSPWDLDGPQVRRSFANLVHQDHIHLAVVDG